MVEVEERTVASVISARELSERQSETLAALLSRKLHKPVELDLKTDPSLLGGLLIYVEGNLIDHTIKKHMQDMGNAIQRSIHDESAAW